MKIISLFFLLVFSFGFSQNADNNHDNYWSQMDSTNAIISAANCYVRAQPDHKATLLDSLQLGDEVIV